MQPYGSLIKGALHFLWRTPEGIHTIQGVIWHALKFQIIIIEALQELQIIMSVSEGAMPMPPSILTKKIPLKIADAAIRWPVITPPAPVDRPSKEEQTKGVRPCWNAGHRHKTCFKQKLIVNAAFLMEQFKHDDNKPAVKPDHFTTYLSHLQDLNANDDGTCNYMHPCAFAASENSDNTLHYGEMIKTHNRENFQDAMETEIDGLNKSAIFNVEWWDELPKGAAVMKAIWSFCCKLLPDAVMIQKWKAWLCAQGGQQELGMNYWETYAPVVSFSTVGLVLSLSLIAKMQSQQVNYIQVYPQAGIDCDIYMDVPAGFHIVADTLSCSHTAVQNTNSRDYVLKLRKNLYGLKQAGCNCFLN